MVTRTLAWHIFLIDKHVTYDQGEYAELKGADNFLYSTLYFSGCEYSILLVQHERMLYEKVELLCGVSN